MTADARANTREKSMVMDLRYSAEFQSESVFGKSRS